MNEILDLQRDLHANDFALCEEHTHTPFAKSFAYDAICLARRNYIVILSEWIWTTFSLSFIMAKKFFR